MPSSRGTPCDINKIYTSLKSGLQLRRWQYGSVFIRLAVIASKTREMSRNSKRICPYSSPRSSNDVDLGVNRKPTCDFLLIINIIVTLAASATILEIFTLIEIDKKAVLSQRWPRDARYISRPWAVAEIWPFEIIQDGGGRHLEFIRIENSAVRSAVPENPTL